MLKKHPSKNPLRGLIPFFPDAAINIPSLRDWRGFWSLQGFRVISGSVGKPNHRCQFRDCFMIFCSTDINMLKKHPSNTQKYPSKNTPYGAWVFARKRCYKHAAETPKQINATRLKRVLKSSRFPRHIRFGWETEPTGPGVETVIFF